MLNRIFEKKISTSDADELIRNLRRTVDFITVTQKPELYKPIQVLDAAVKYFYSLPPEMMTMEDKMLNIKVNSHIIARNPEAWCCEHIMTSPASMIFIDDETKICVVAKQQELKPKTSLESIQDKDALNNSTWAILDEVADELARQIFSLKAEGFMFIPYVPIAIFRAVDSNTFQPVIGFKTRYATYKCDTKPGILKTLKDGNS